MSETWFLFYPVAPASTSKDVWIYNIITLLAAAYGSKFAKIFVKLTRDRVYAYILLYVITLTKWSNPILQIMLFLFRTPHTDHALQQIRPYDELHHVRCYYIN